MDFLNKPQRLWWRRAVFQIHLWMGIALCLYMLVIGVTGSLLVFASPIDHLAYARLWRASDVQGNTRPIHLPAAIDAAKHAYPGFRPTIAYVPDKPGDNFEVFLSKQHQTLSVFVDAHTGRVAGAVNPAHTWLNWIVDLHFRLLAGHTGLILNGIGAICLLLLCMTGLIIWWRGLRHWSKGLRIDLRRSWPRINFDLHSAVGFWTLLILSVWAVSGIYFAWPKQVEAFVNHFSSVASADPPKIIVPPRGSPSWVPLQNMILLAKRSSPHARFAGAFFPAGNKAPLTLLMAHGAMRNFSRMDYIYFDPVSGHVLGIWHRWLTRTWGSRLIYLLGPLHYGYYWGTDIMILWAVLGCALPLLMITGLWMYWNRSLSRKWKALAAWKHR